MKLLYLITRERRVLIKGSLCSPFKSGGFFGTFECTGKGYVGRELFLLHSRERRTLMWQVFMNPKLGKASKSKIRKKVQKCL